MHAMITTRTRPVHSLYRIAYRIALPSGALLCIAGLFWLFIIPARRLPIPLPQQEAAPAAVLASGVNAAMTSPAVTYTDGWRVTPAGADPPEPADPWREPAGTLAFSYTGRELALLLAEGDYWGYLFVTVDGKPANRLTNIRGNTNSESRPAGYKTFYAPEIAVDGTSAVRPRLIHVAADDGPHRVAVEVWRSWSQTPIRGVLIDALPSPGRPRWPGVALLAAGGWLLGWRGARRVSALRAPATWRRAHTAWCDDERIQNAALFAASFGLLTAGVGAYSSLWGLTLAGVTLLGAAALARPALWFAALMFALPFYFGIKLPLLPGRAFEIIDIGVLGGVLLWLFTLFMHESPPDKKGSRLPFWLLMALTTWALISAVAADYQSLALREWRTVFLDAALFAVALRGLLAYSRRPQSDRALIVGAWLAGATLMALIGWGQFWRGDMAVTAEGVRRVRGLYGSPNNLALYLERTLAVTLALALFSRGKMRFGSIGMAAIQGGALLLTFSKGAIFLALPALLLTLWIGGFYLLGKRGESRRILWWLAGAALLAGLGLLPFLATERFQRLLDFRSGTGFLRLQLWHSAWRMALDHSLLGVGPDNFLYFFRNRYILPAAWQEPNLNHPHTWLLDWWTRLGIPGMALGLGFWFSGIRGLIVRLSRTQTTGSLPVLALGFLAASIAALAHGLIDISYALPDLMIVWAFLLAGGVIREA
ncbi:MAG: O-antigen ligase family protein [Caldilineaceae bacterium]|nr:O-antigen ligase family protein [Caldilineaceae bacterium]